ncbi:MAG: carboxypeptidase-like regulatory domain-containing protein [Polaribacter sp.]|uniref:carboxypeptidase-like regulatory domain-containing protein n=1 Tax=Polaribacter sp. TaxID=1920175 RepID=UPI0032666B79
MAKKLLQLFLLLFISISLSQEKGTLITGQIVDSLGIVKNANIINLKTNQGTFSSDNGNFQIYVSIGDSLQISSIQHITRKITVSKNRIKNKSLKIKLEQNTYVLEEFELKKNHLSGILGVDVNTVPTNKKDSLLRNVMDFSNVDFTQKDYRIDEKNRLEAGVVKTVSNSYEGLKIGFGTLFRSKKSKKNKALLKKLIEQEVIPEKILTELGEDYFFKTLKIPVENYSHFIEYCNPYILEKLYKENKILELITILKKESTGYLKIIKTK